MPLDWEALARAYMHKDALHLLQCFEQAAAQNQRLSPNALAEALGKPLGNTSYHVRTLYRKGLLTKAGTAQRRGAVEHYYRISEKARR